MMPQSSGLRAGAAARLMIIALATLVITATAARAAQSAGTPADQGAALMVAESALQHGKCHEASEAYAKAAVASSDARVAARASQVAIGCEQVLDAQLVTSRWQKLDPQSGEAALARTLVALKLYQLDEARRALKVWNDSGAAGNQDPGRFAELLESETDVTATYRVFGDVLVGDDATGDVVMAQASLALHAFDMGRAIQLAQRALTLEASLTPAKVILVRAQATLGRYDEALTLARQIQGQVSGEDAFLVADVLAAAQRNEESRQELLRLRAQSNLAAAADRRLGAQALDVGDEAEAEQRFTALLGTRGSTTFAMAALAQLAERRGEDDRALRNYALLVDSSIALQARGAAARILLRRGKRAEAMALLEDYQNQHPESAIDTIEVRSQAYAAQGDFTQALAEIDAALKDYPAHPALEYQRATMLERAGKHREAEAAFEAILRKRPEDPGITNALGFTLADHNRSLDRAEKLIRQALAVSPDNPAIQDSLGWTYYRKGKLADAAKVLELAWRNGHDADIGAHFGELLWKQGNEGRARYVWQQALNLDPQSALVRSTQRRLTGEAPPTSAR